MVKGQVEYTGRSVNARATRKRRHSMAVISSDHADESLCAESFASRSLATKARLISAGEIEQNNEGAGGASFWAVVDGFVCDVSQFLDTHPGGLRKLLSTNTGATDKPYGFSFSRGRNAHFPNTGKAFRDGVETFLRGDSQKEAANHKEGSFLPPVTVELLPHGQLFILGRFAQ